MALKQKHKERAAVHKVQGRESAKATRYGLYAKNIGEASKLLSKAVDDFSKSDADKRRTKKGHNRVDAQVRQFYDQQQSVKERMTIGNFTRWMRPLTAEQVRQNGGDFTDEEFDNWKKHTLDYGKPPDARAVGKAYASDLANQGATTIMQDGRLNLTNYGEVIKKQTGKHWSFSMSEEEYTKGAMIYNARGVQNLIDESMRESDGTGTLKNSDEIRQLISSMRREGRLTVKDAGVLTKLEVSARMNELRNYNKKQNVIYQNQRRAIERNNRAIEDQTIEKIDDITNGNATPSQAYRQFQAPGPTGTATTRLRAQKAIRVLDVRIRESVWGSLKAQGFEAQLKGAGFKSPLYMNYYQRDLTEKIYQKMSASNPHFKRALTPNERHQLVRAQVKGLDFTTSGEMSLAAPMVGLSSDIFSEALVMNDARAQGAIQETLVLYAQRNPTYNGMTAAEARGLKNLYNYFGVRVETPQEKKTGVLDKIKSFLGFGGK